MSDRVARSADACDCGLPFALLASIEGRAEDILQLPSATGGTIAVHPNVFHRVMEPLPVREWQAVQLTVELATAVTRTPLGKARLVRALRR